MHRELIERFELFARTLHSCFAPPCTTSQLFARRVDIKHSASSIPNHLILPFL